MIFKDMNALALFVVAAVVLVAVIWGSEVNPCKAACQEALPGYTLAVEEPKGTCKCRKDVIVTEFVVKWVTLPGPATGEALP